MTDEYEYDVCLSFAGEQRADRPEEVAEPPPVCSIPTGWCCRLPRRSRCSASHGGNLLPSAG